MDYPVYIVLVPLGASRLISRRLTSRLPYRRLQALRRKVGTITSWQYSRRASSSRRIMETPSPTPATVYSIARKSSRLTYPT
jgi:hypothetical protein